MTNSESRPCAALAICRRTAALAIVTLAAGACDPIEWFVENLQPGIDPDASMELGQSSREPREVLDAETSSAHSVDMRTKAVGKAAVVRRAKAKEFTFYAAPDVARPNYKRTPVPVDLVAPFRVETTVGLCDPSFAPDDVARFGASIRENGGAGKWSVACRRFGGLEVSAAFGGGGTRLFSGADRVDLAIEHTGAQIVAYARDPEISSTWTEIDRDTPGTTTGAFYVELFARDFQPGAMTSVYALKFITNGPPASGTGAQREGALDIAQATTPLLTAGEDLQGLDADADAAASGIDAAQVQVDDAVAKLDVKAAKAKPTPEEKALKAAVKRLKAQSKALGRSATLLRKHGLKKAKTVRKQIAAVIKQLALAFDGAVPADLRALTGGKKLTDYVAK